MRATLVSASLILAVIVAVGCNSEGNNHAYGDHDSNWGNNGRYDDQYRDARPAGGEIEPYHDRSWDNDWHRYRDDVNN